MKKIIMFVMVMVIGLTAGIANADLLVSESFEYTAGEPLKGQNGGTGWAGKWVEDVVALPSAEIGDGSLEPPGVVGTGNHVKVVDNSGDGEMLYTRDLTTPLLDDGSTYWVSAVFQKTNSENTNSWCGFALGENIWFGKGYNEDNLILHNNVGDSVDTGVPATDLSWLVLKIKTNPAADERVYLWVNPDAGNEPSITTANAYNEIPLEVTPGDADFFLIEYGGSGTANSGDFKGDEIKIGTLFDDVFVEVGPKNPIVIDPNVMTVYETDETEGDFAVGLKFPAVKQAPPDEGTPVTVDFVVDPNGGGGPSPDIDFLDGVGGMDQVTFSRTGNDLSQVVIRFKAINDVIAEPPELEEEKEVLIYTTCAQEPNFVRSKIARLIVVDNDQADILFELVETGKPIRETPVTLMEYQLCTFWHLGVCQNWVTFPQTIGVSLQVKPENDENPGSQGYVRVIVEQEGGADNPPTMDPPLLPEGPVEPNAILFTSDGNPVPGIEGAALRKWDVPFNIVVVGVDDDQLQAEGASEDGDQYYQANLAFSVTEATDKRYHWYEEDPEDPCAPEIPVGLEKTVDIKIEDNECGAYGILPLDVGNSDPCAIDEDGNPLPDCYVDIYDVIELATQWLDCSDIHDPSCESYL